MGSAQVRPNLIRFGVFEADLQAGELRRSGAKVRLQELPFRALTLLLSRPGEVIGRDEFRQALWPSDVFVDFEQGISSAIMRLRTALKDSAENPVFIETVGRRGYRWIAPAQPFPLEIEDLAIPIETPPTTPGDRIVSVVRHPASRKLYWLVAGAMAVLVLAGFLTFRIRRPPISSIAILPFDNLSAPAFDDAFSDGLTDEVAASISHLQGVRVAGRRSAYLY